MDTTGTLDEALDRLHSTGPEMESWDSNHGPMAVEALVRRGEAVRVHRWLDGYLGRLLDMPAPQELVTEHNWQQALGDPHRAADWTAYFARELADHPWREVLARWWPRLLPGIAGGSTHPVIRVGHAVRTLLDGDQSAPRLTELAHALGYWAARHQPLPPVRTLGPAATAAAALDAVPPVASQRGGLRDRIAQLTAFPAWPVTDSPEEAQRRLSELVSAATHRYAAHAHGSPIMMVHAATAPNAVLRTLPALPPELWPDSLRAAWAASAAVTAAYTPPEPAPYSPALATAEELFALAATGGNDHAIKFTDTALDIGDPTALAAAARAIALNSPR